MAWIPFYADESDFIKIVDWLNRVEDIAFIVSAGLHKWKTIKDVNYHHLHEECLILKPLFYYWSCRA